MAYALGKVAVSENAQRPRWAAAFTREALMFALLTGVLGSVVFGIFLEPITDATRTALLNLAGGLGRAVVDGTYRLAVRGPEAEALVIAAAGTLWLYVTGTLLTAAATHALHRSVVRMHDEATGSEQLDEKPRRDPAKRAKRLRWLVREGQFLKVASLALAVLVPPAAYLEFYRISSALEIRGNYSLNLLSMSSFTSEHQRDSLDAEWARVKTRGDFQRLHARMSSIATQHKQKLVLEKLQ